MMQKLHCTLLCVPFFCSTLWAQRESEYRAGRLLKVSNQSFVMPDRAGKTAYLLHIPDSSNEYIALYNVNSLFGHDRSERLKPDSDIQFRISGKNLFLKTPENKEIKGRLCEKVKIGDSPAIKCGDLILLGKDAE